MSVTVREPRKHKNAFFLNQFFKNLFKKVKRMTEFETKLQDNFTGFKQTRHFFAITISTKTVCETKEITKRRNEANLNHKGVYLKSCTQKNRSKASIYFKKH